MRSNRCIPIFLSDRGCMNRCVFCNQKTITGKTEEIMPFAARSIIERALFTCDAGDAVEIAYFGGSFTGLKKELQEDFLSLACEYKASGKVGGIRLSTRPDMIDDETIDRLLRFKVTAVELGAQSFSSDVLEKSGRGHTPDDTYAAAEKIKKAGISLGLQMMVGLPSDTLEKSLFTANEIVRLKSDCTRIYPALVLKDTELENMYNRGEYIPLTLDEAITWCVGVKNVMDLGGVPIYRMGLMAEQSLAGKIIAGPAHDAFGELVISRGFLEKASKILKNFEGAKEAVIYVNPKTRSKMIGQKRSNIEKIKGQSGINITVEAKDGLGEEEIDIKILA